MVILMVVTIGVVITALETPATDHNHTLSTKTTLIIIPSKILMDGNNPSKIPTASNDKSDGIDIECEQTSKRIGINEANKLTNLSETSPTFKLRNEPHGD